MSVILNDSPLGVNRCTARAADVAEAASGGAEPGDSRCPKRVAVVWNAVSNRLWRIDAYGRKYRVRPERTGGGFGKAASRQLSVLGLGSLLLTSCGSDEAGAALIQEFIDWGADVRGVQVLPQATMIADVIVCGNDRTILIDPGSLTASWQLNGSDRELVEEVDAVCIGGTLPDNVLAAVLEMVGQLSKPTFINPTRIHRLEAFDLSGVDIVQVSHDDFANFGVAPEAPTAALADALLGQGCGTVVVTDSCEGEWAFARDGQSVHMPAVPGCAPLFPTGCGDTAFAAHVAGNLRGLNTFDWLNVGTLAGAFFIEHGYPAPWAEIERLACAWPPARRLAAVAGR